MTESNETTASADGLQHSEGFRAKLARMREHQHERAVQGYWERTKGLSDRYPQAFSFQRANPDGLTLAAAHGVPLRKTCALEGNVWKSVGSSAKAFKFTYHPVTFATFDALADFLEDLTGAMENACLLRAGLHQDWAALYLSPRRWHASERDDDDLDGPLIDVARTWLVLDIDEWQLPDGCGYHDPEGLICRLMKQLPEPFKGKACVYHWSSRAGITDTDKIKVHLFFRSTAPVGCRDYHACLQLLQDRGAKIDPQIGVGTQIIYTAEAELIGGSDPFVGSRVGIYGNDDDLVDMSGLLADLRENQKVRAGRHRVNRLRVSGDDPGAEGEVPPDWCRRPVPAVARPYVGAWTHIAGRKMGYGVDPATKVPCTVGYRTPIFSMLGAAIGAGEKNLDHLKEKLRSYVWAEAERKGDLPKKTRDLDAYLSDRDLDAAIAYLVNSTYGVTVATYVSGQENV